jgi:hypothetical protein
MTLRVRRRLLYLLLCGTGLNHAHALFNFNQGKDLVFVSASYSIGWDSNVFTRAASQGAFSQSASASIDYSRQAGLIGVNVTASASSGSFAGIRGQDFFDPSVSVAFRKRYGRTTGAWTTSARHESQPDPDVGERTKAWAYNSVLDVRYPISDRFYLSNNLGYSGRFYTNNKSFSDLDSYSESISANYVYTSKLDLNTGYSIRISQTSKDTTAYDQSLTVGASGGILPKLTGLINVGIQRRDSDSTLGHHEAFTSFTSATSLKWLFSRKISFSGDLVEDFSTSATDISTNRLSAGLHGTASLTSKFIGNAGATYSITHFLGVAGEGRRDDLLQFDASLGLALTTHIRLSLSFLYMINWSTLSSADFERESVTLTAIATY